MKKKGKGGPDVDLHNTQDAAISRVPAVSSLVSASVRWQRERNSQGVSGWTLVAALKVTVQNMSSEETQHN